MDLKDTGDVVQAEVADLKLTHVEPVGTVRLIDHNELILIPTPSPDPRGISTFEFCQLILLMTFRSIEFTAMEEVGNHGHSESL